MKISRIKFNINLLEWYIIPQIDNGKLLQGFLKDRKYFTIKFLCFNYSHELISEKTKINIE